MVEEVKEAKHRLSNGVLLAILGVLIIAIIGLIVGIVVTRSHFVDEKYASPQQPIVSENSPTNLDEVLAEVDEQYSGDVLADMGGAMVFDEYMREKLANEEYSQDEVFAYYSGAAGKTDGVAQLNYLYFYASLYYDETKDLDGAIGIVEGFDGELEGDSNLAIQYYAYLRSLCENAGDEELSNYYDGLIREHNSSETYEIPDYGGFVPDENFNVEGE